MSVHEDKMVTFKLFVFKNQKPTEIRKFSLKSTDLSFEKMEENLLAIFPDLKQLKYTLLWKGAYNSTSVQFLDMPKMKIINISVNFHQNNSTLSLPNYFKKFVLFRITKLFLKICTLSTRKFHVLLTFKINFVEENLNFPFCSFNSYFLLKLLFS